MPLKNRFSGAPSSLLGTLTNETTTVPHPCALSSPQFYRSAAGNRRKRDRELRRTSSERGAWWRSIATAMSWVMDEVVVSLAEYGEAMYPSFFLLGEHVDPCDHAESPRYIGCARNPCQNLTSRRSERL
jgi:hypothetical protein